MNTQSITTWTLIPRLKAAKRALLVDKTKN